MPIGCCSLVPAIATELGLRRPASVLDPSRGETFLSVIMKGGTIKEACDLLGIDTSDPYDWIRNEGCVIGDKPFSEAYFRARVVDADRIADEVGRLAVKAEAMADDRQSRPDGIRVAMQGLQWLVSVRNPSRYNPRVRGPGYGYRWINPYLPGQHTSQWWDSEH